MNNREQDYGMNDDRGDGFISALKASLSRLGIDALTEAQAGQLAKHYSMLREWNRRVNLTRIVEPEDAAQFHYADSLFGGRFIDGARTILDIGSGAGFPAIPLAVLRPDVHVTALEANQKKSLFLNEAKDALRLANFKVATARIESYDPAAFDLLTSRALDRAGAVLPPIITKLRAGQRFMLYCAPDLIAELDGRLGSVCKVETHPVPQTESRLIAIYSVIGGVGQKSSV